MRWFFTGRQTQADDTKTIGNISLASVLFLVFGFASGKLLTKDFLAPFLDVSGGALLPYLITFVGFLLSLRGGQQPGAARRRFIVLVTATLLIVLMTTWRQSLVRMTNFVRIHDGAIQTEVAADFLLRGQNPYAADFKPTAFGQAPSPYRPDAVNLAWTHYVYPPAVILSAVPSVAFRPWLGPLTDIRWLYVLVLVAMVGAVVKNLKSWEHRSLAVVVILANPFIWLYAVAGFNDVLAIAGMVGSVLAVRRQRWGWAGVMMGLALAAKQTAWLALPLWVWWLWRSGREQKHTANFRASMVSLIITTAALYLPFFLWGPADMYDDLVRYVSGTIPYSYPISGSTFLQFFRIFGFIDSPWALIPTWPYQLIAAAVSGWFAWRWLRRTPTGAMWLLASAAVTLSVAMVSRFFNDNYLSAIVLLGVVAYFFDHDTEHTVS